MNYEEEYKIWRADHAATNWSRLDIDIDYEFDDLIYNITPIIFVNWYEWTEVNVTTPYDMARYIETHQLGYPPDHYVVKKRTMFRITHVNEYSSKPITIKAVNKTKEESITDQEFRLYFKKATKVDSTLSVLDDI